MDGVVVCAENDELRMTIGVDNIAAAATGDDYWPDDDGVIDVVELQLCGSSRRHLGEINNEGFRLVLSAASCNDDRLSGCSGCSGGDDGANVKLGVAWQAVDEGLSLLDQLLLVIRRGVALEDGIGEGLLGLLR